MSATLESALLLADLEESGLTVRADAAGRLLVTPTAKLTAGQREDIKRWRDDLLALVGERSELDRAVLSRPPPDDGPGFVWTGGRFCRPPANGPAGSARPAGGGGR